MTPAGALSWLEHPPAPGALAEALAGAGAATAEEAAALADAVDAARAGLEAAARAAFAGAPVSRSTAAFHSALPDLRPFVLYRLPGLLDEAGIARPGELRTLAGSASPGWLAAQALRQLAALAGAREAVRRLAAGDLPPAAFPAAVRSAAAAAAAARPAAAVQPEEPR
ncbi:hypothetical protein O0235_05900 [Tepidiforma flava]|uniref:Uncharacterized protein n=1 Tax=Tepidiforma flava TaxID=3004094 RepID=A0ABY7MAL2_9CHLR|nr:hypothetical protein [Tepidiforma flava]WBL37099.1 hypothetical protein O0235_05900 [Tepidiforma flava]